MIPPDQSFYARWRQRSGVISRLRDDDTPPERLVQAVWQHQRLMRDRLVTTDGRHVRVLHPGFGNAEGGPDFRDALIQFDDNTPRTGDVEVDLRTSGWHSHGHHTNPNFRNVVLGLHQRPERLRGSPFAFDNLSTAWTPFTYEWDLGDGTVLHDSDLVHIYTNPGTYTVSLTAATNA